MVQPEVSSMVDNDIQNQQIEALVWLQILSDVLIFCSFPKPLNSHSAGLIPIGQDLGRLQREDKALEGGTSGTSGDQAAEEILPELGMVFSHAAQEYLLIFVLEGQTGSLSGSSGWFYQVVITEEQHILIFGDSNYVVYNAQILLVCQDLLVS